MCGIGGFFREEGMPTDEALRAVRGMQAALHNRGPDSRGAVLVDAAGRVSPVSEGRGGAGAAEGVTGALVHTRLSILDLSSAGNQPMSTEEGRYWIVYNGEVYNFAEIRQELAGTGRRFRSRTDTEVVLAAYVKWGAGCLERFNGMYAFVIYDVVTRRVFAARDRIGIKPFYYVSGGGRFLFGSDVTSLIASGLYAPEPNWEGIFHGLAFRGAPRPMTAFAGVRALPPGHYLQGTVGGGFEERLYWDLPVNEHTEMREGEATEAFDALLRKAVKRTLVSDVEVATLMSGGVDSTTMSAIAALEHNGISAFTLASGEETEVEGEVLLARATARRYPMRHIVTAAEPGEELEWLDNMAWLFEEPIGALEPHYPIAKHVSEYGIKVLLNGLGPDEMLGGYAHYEVLRNRWMRYGPFRRLAPLIPPVHPFLTHLKRTLEQPTVADLYHELFAACTEPGNADVFSESRETMGWDSKEHLSTVFPRVTEIEDPVQAMSYLDFKLYIGTHHNHTTDRFLMNFHIEGRFPYLDHEVVEFCFRLKPDLKVGGGETKRLMRRVAANYIDPASLRMKKRGFSLSELDHVNVPAVREKIEERLTALRARGVVSTGALDGVMGKMAGDGRVARCALFLANLEYWLQNHIEKKHPLFAETF